MKRQRVPKACQKCRALKAKCDGQQPTCRRCAGYGFNCTWATRRNVGSHIEFPTGPRLEPGLEGGGSSSHTSSSSPSLDRYVELRRLATAYETLIEPLRLKLKGPERAAVDTSLKTIQEQFIRNVANGEPPGNPLLRPGTAASPSDSYLGKASDVQFVNLVRDSLQNGGTPESLEDKNALIYDESKWSYINSTLKKPRHLPERQVAVTYVETYFSTIHVAYPFLCEPMVFRHLNRLSDGDIDDATDDVWFGLLNFIFAIGCYYTSFSASATNAPEEYLNYVEQAVCYSNEIMGSSTSATVWVLLVQCFCLLTTSQTDKCWNTLGLAIRMSQCIGLHISVPYPGYASSPRSLEHELRRRTWYSLYVLDRLSALQLGRPFAIHQEDFAVELPSRVVLPDFDVGGQCAPSVEPVGETEESGEGGANNQDRSYQRKQSSDMDYFLNVISFSHILGQVIKELYHPTQVETSPDDMLQSVSSLDQLLWTWRLDLPHHLRFDLGHAFEKSVIFKRQRNMLAIKYHHLRALVHRPFSCLPWLRQHDSAFIDLLQRNQVQIDRAEQICVSEAQQTARSLHNVIDEKSLIQDFPWWQMISCLICASSVLLVASSFSRQIQNPADSSPHDFSQDAHTCLKVFEASSVNSSAARKAADLFKALARSRLSSDQRLEKQLPCWPSSSAYIQPLDESTATSAGLDLHPMTGNFSANDLASSTVNDANMVDWSQWPSEMSNTMAWSAQFSCSVETATYEPPDSLDSNGAGTSHGSNR